MDCGGGLTQMHSLKVSTELEIKRRAKAWAMSRDLFETRIAGIPVSH